MRAFSVEDHVPDPHRDPLLGAFPPVAATPYAWCLEHQAVEDQMSPIGLVCPCCKHRLYVSPPQGRCRSFWESQPAARSMDRQPRFVYTLIWDDFRIRSLHAPGVDTDPRGPLAQLMLSAE
jgi:hypothetical protein